MSIIVLLFGKRAKRPSRKIYMGLPSQWSGVGRLLDIWGQFDDDEFARWRDRSNEESIGSDWWVVGEDFKPAIRQMDHIPPQP